MRSFIWFLVFFLTLFSSLVAAPTVTDVVAKQRYPWNGKVDITCKVTGIDGTAQWKFAVAAVMPDTGNARKVYQFWVVKNGVNSTDKKVQANGTYKLLWDAKAELGQVTYDNMVMRVTVIDHDMIQLWEGGPYWAETNIGAENPEDRGYYFWWGDTVGYKRENGKWVASDGSSSDFSFSESNTPTYSKDIATLKNEGWITADSVLDPVHDAAHVHWGGDWRMPTLEELFGLNSKCDWTGTNLNGVGGYVLKGKGAYADRSIFLPASCAYWSSMPASDYEQYWGAFSVKFNVNNFLDSYIDHRYYGWSVRPVRGFAE